MIELKTCPGLGPEEGHELPATLKNFYAASKGGGLRALCITHYRADRTAADRASRADEPRGIYLAGLLLASGEWLLKPGKVGDGLSGFPSKNRCIAKSGRKHGLDVVYGQIFYVIDAPDAGTRSTMEKWLLDQATAIIGKEYFAGKDITVFEGYFERYGRLFDESKHFAARWDAFNAARAA